LIGVVLKEKILEILVCVFLIFRI